MTNSYLNDIKNFPEETRKEFLLVLKKNLTEFFSKIEIAIQTKDIEAINQLVHKVNPTLIMLELDAALQFFTMVKETKIDTDNIEELLIQLITQKKSIQKQGWL